MKSAAFNLAFKVHRNEVPFPDGLLQSVESNAQHDFIEALNSLAGSQKYDLSQLDSLIAQAKSSMSNDSSASSSNIERIEKEIRELKGEARDYKSSIHMLEAQSGTFMTTVIPGINSLMLFLVGLVVLLVLFAVNLIMAALVILLLLLIGCGTLIYIDLNKLKQQKAVIDRKREKNRIEIDKIQAKIEEVQEQLQAKQQELAKFSQPKEPQAPPTILPPIDEL